MQKVSKKYSISMPQVKIVKFKQLNIKSVQFTVFNFILKLQNIFNLYNETGQGVEVIEDSYHIMGLRVGYQATEFMNVFVYANNLLNQQYQINYRYPMPGTTVFAGLNLKLVKE